MFYVVPDSISDDIDRRLDAEIAKHPDAEKDRAVLRSQLVEFVNEHGYVPDFTLGRAETFHGD